MVGRFLGTFRHDKSDKCLDWTAEQVDSLSPGFLVPFSSCVWLFSWRGFEDGCSGSPENVTIPPLKKLAVGSEWMSFASPKVRDNSYVHH